jgi:C4-dicarboxylate transporter DctM subunit
MFHVILAKAERLGIYISGFFILVMMVLTTIDTFLRDVLDRPLSGVYELSSMMMVGVLYLGLPYVQSKRKHIRMDLLSSKLAPNNQLLLQLLADVIFLSLAVIITWQMGLKFFNAWTSGDFYYGVVRFPLWPAKLTICLGTTLVSIRLILDIILNPLWYKQAGGSVHSRYFRILVAFFILAIFAGSILFTVHQDISAITAGWIAILIFLFLLFIGVPVATSMALIGICGFWLLSGAKSALGTAASVPFSAASEYTMTVLPLFMALGIFASLAGFAEKGFDLAKKWMEQIKGGIVHATVVGSAIFAAATGSGAASCAVLTKITMPEMLRNGVKKSMAIGVVASASTLAVMIPPSTTFVIYAMLTGNSIGKLLIAGIIPGLICAAMIMLTVYIRCRIAPSLVSLGSVRNSSWKERFSAIPGAWGVMLIVLVIIGGIFTGFFTPTEAGAVGAFVAFAAVLILKKGKRREIFRVLSDSAELASTILFIIVGGTLFGNMISVTRLPVMLSEWVVGLNIPPIAILICIILIYMILGCFLDALSTLIITIPIVYPIILELGFSPIWFGVLMVQNMEIAAITPPYGINLFILKGVLPETSMGEIFRGVLWFILPLVVSIAIYIAFPQVALWLPDLMSR